MHTHHFIFLCTHSSYTYAYTQPPLHTHPMHTHPYAYMHTQMHTHPNAYTPKCIHTHMHTHPYAYTPICIHTHMHTHPYVYTPICTHTHMHTHPYAYTSFYMHTHLMTNTMCLDLSVPTESLTVIKLYHASCSMLAITVTQWLRFPYFCTLVLIRRMFAPWVCEWVTECVSEWVRRWSQRTVCTDWYNA